MSLTEVKQKIRDHFYIAIGSLLNIRSGLRIRVEHREGLESDPELEHMVVRQEEKKWRPNSRACRCQIKFLRPHLYCNRGAITILIWPLNFILTTFKPTFWNLLHFTTSLYSTNKKQHFFRCI